MVNFEHVTAGWRRGYFFVLQKQLQIVLGHGLWNLGATKNQNMADLEERFDYHFMFALRRLS